MTTVWTAAMPITMLATPMLVKYVAFDIGVGNFFFILAALPVVFFLFVPLAFPPKTLGSTSADPRVSLKLMGPVILMLILFQASTMSVSLAGITHPVTLLLLAVMVGAGAVLFLRRRATVVSTKLPSHVAMMMALLFLLQIASTGLYDAAYLIRHLCSSSFIADRATLGAMAQIAGVFGAGALLLRWPQLSYPLLWTSLALVLAGTLMMMLYPYRPADVTLFLSSKAVLSAGVGIGSAVLVRSILAAAGDNRVIIMAPAFLILIGTEVGIELLEIVFEVTEIFNGDVNAAYENAFRFQTLAPLAAMAVLLIGGTRSWRYLHPANASY